MSNKFITSLWSATDTSWPGRLKDLVLTVPPATVGTQFTITLSTPSGVSIGSVTTPSGVTWASPTLTVGPSFSGTGQVTISLTGAKTSSTFFSLVLAPGIAKAGSQSTVRVDEYGWMKVTTLGSDFKMEGLYFLIQEIPSSGALLTIAHPVVLIPSVTSGNPDFRFEVSPGYGLAGGTLSLNATNGVTVSGNTATAQSSLAPGNSATVTATYTPDGGNPTVSTFTIQRLSNETKPSGGLSRIRLNSDRSFTVTSLTANVFLRGLDVTFKTTSSGTYHLDFHTATSGLQFLNPPVVFKPDGGAFNWLSLSPTGVRIICTNNPGKSSTDFDLRTNRGTLDPTIINNPDLEPQLDS